MATLSAEGHRVLGVTGSHDGSTIVTWNLDGDLWLHSADGSEVTRRLRVDGGIHCAALSQNDSYLAAGGIRGTVTGFYSTDPTGCCVPATRYVSICPMAKRNPGFTYR